MREIQWGKGTKSYKTKGLRKCKCQHKLGDVDDTYHNSITVQRNKSNKIKAISSKSIR